MVDIVPAILSYSRHDLLDKIARVRGVARAVHIDIMDGQFVHNKTIGIAEASDLPFERVVEYHLMVSDPARYIEALPGGQNVIYQVHIEAAGGQMQRLFSLAAAKHSKLAVALNPSSGLETIMPVLPQLSHVLVMAVVPGLDGQKYMESVEGKISQLRSLRHEMIIEVDGGIGLSTARRAALAGADRLAAATSIFKMADASSAYRNLLLAANGNG